MHRPSSNLPRSLPTFIAALGLGALLGGCQLSGAIGRSASAFFSTPKSVPQEKHPVTPDARLAVVWIGHATALVQIDDKVILTDPVFTSTVGQVSRRLVAPGMDPKDLPPIDAVLISHMHYDHLSLASLEMIEPRVRALMLPRGGTAYLTDWFSFPAYELRTWQAWERDGLRVTAVPVDHVGFRYGLDDAWMEHSFTGYVVEYHGIKVYFGGDTAYDQAMFVETGERFPKIDLALLPIAPIEPRSFMRRFHLDPAQALRAFFDLGATRMVPIHYGTFVDSTDEPGDALDQLGKAKARWSMGQRTVTPIAVGQRKVFIKRGEGPPVPEPAEGTTPTTPTEPKEPAEPKTNVPDDDSFE